ncbi:MAG: magnesium transporter, partial [Gammaproteobacteria bacterium]
RGGILLELSPPVKESLVDAMGDFEVMKAAENLDSGELAYLAQYLPDSVVNKIIESLSPEDRDLFELALSYPEGTVGSLMDFNMITVREDTQIKAVLRYCRSLGDLPNHTDRVFVVDRDGAFKGSVLLQKLVTLPLEAKIGEAMKRSAVKFSVDDPAQEAANAFERYDLISAPVVDKENKLIGRVCVVDILDFIRERAERIIMYQAGFMEGEDRFSGVWKGAQNRWLWFAVNLISAFIATRVISVFEGTIEHLVALAALMPVVAASGGNVGNQAGTLIIRSLALNQISPHNVRQFYLKEMGICMVNGLVWGGALGLFVGYLYQNYALGGILMIAMLLNLLLAAFFGISIPLIRQKYQLDPAIGTHVLITFFADSFGFLFFLGLAAVFLT